MEAMNQQNPHYENIKYMRRKGPPANLKASDEQIIDAAKKYGTSIDGIKKIAEELGYSGVQSIFQRVRRLTKA
jgi:hypothetical protein